MPYGASLLGAPTAQTSLRDEPHMPETFGGAPLPASSAPVSVATWCAGEPPLAAGSPNTHSSDGDGANAPDAAPHAKSTNTLIVRSARLLPSQCQASVPPHAPPREPITHASCGPVPVTAPAIGVSESGAVVQAKPSKRSNARLPSTSTSRALDPQMARGTSGIGNEIARNPLPSQCLRR